MNRDDLAALNIPDEAISAILELHESSLKAAVEEVDQRLGEENFNQLLDLVISQSKPKNAKAIKAVLDLDALKASEDRLTSLRDAVKDLQKNESYLFEPDFPIPPLYAAGTGSATIFGPVSSDYEKAFRDGIGATEDHNKPSFYDQVAAAFAAMGREGV